MDATDLYGVISNETMPSLNEFKRRLTFANTAITEDQNSNAEYLYESTVNGLVRRKHV